MGEILIDPKDVYRRCKDCKSMTNDPLYISDEPYCRECASELYWLGDAVEESAK